MNFKGYDWTELTECFGLFDKELEDEMLLQKTRNYLVSKHFSDGDYLAGEIRCFLRMLYQNCLKAQRYNTPIWKGLLDVKDDFTLIKYTIILLDVMWF